MHRKETGQHIVGKSKQDKKKEEKRKKDTKIRVSNDSHGYLPKGTRLVRRAQEPCNAKNTNPCQQNHVAAR
jgi:hypothetical protein